MLQLRRASVVGSVVAVTAAFVPASTVVQAAPPTAVVLIDGLSSPKGVGLADRTHPVVSQGAFGPPGPVLLYDRDLETAFPVSDPIGLVDVAVDTDGTGWGIGADRILYRQDPDGTVTAVFDIPAYQATDPDPYDLDGDGDQSNPYGLLVLPSGDVLIADAQNNDVLRVTRDGEAHTVIRFVPGLVATDHLGDATLPKRIPAENVPTGLALGADGWVYVSELRGFPFRPGSSRIWRFNPNQHDVECASPSRGSCTIAMRGFTALIDVAIDTNSGSVYTYSLAAEGVLAFEEGFATGEFPDAVLTQVRSNGTRRELVAGQLSQPGGVAVARDGTVFVTDGVFENGRLLEIRR